MRTIELTLDRSAPRGRQISTVYLSTPLGGGRGRGGIRGAMGGQGGDGGALPPAPPAVPPRGASWAVLLEQRKKEVQDAAVAGALVTTS